MRIIVAFSITFFLASISHAKAWRGITPLKSTRADVERLLGKPNGLGRYQFDNERAYVLYADGFCNRTDVCECLVPSDTVLGIFVTIEVEMKFSDLKLDLSKFRMKRDTHLSMLVSYSNDGEGIVYTTADDEVTHVTYVPTAKDCQQLLKHRQATQRKMRNR